MRYRIWISFVLLISLLSADAALHGQNLQGDSATAKLVQLCQNPAAYRLGTSENTHLHCQYEIIWHLADEDTDEKNVLRMVCETSGDEATILVLNEKGVPYAIFENGSAYFASSDSNYAIVHIADVKFRITCGSKDFFPSLIFSSELDNSACKLDAFKLCHGLISEEHDCAYSHRNRLFRLTTKSGSESVLRFSREKWLWSFPIEYISVMNKHKQGFEITNITRGPQIAHSIIGTENLLETLFKSNIKRSEPSNEVLGSLFPLGNMSRLESLLSDRSVLQTGRAWLANSRLTNPAAIQSFSELIDSVTFKEDPNAEMQTGSNQLKEKINEICDTILAIAYQPCTSISSDDYHFVVSGCESSKFRHRIEQTIGPRNLQKLSKKLAKSVEDPNLELQARLRAADYLGYVGFTSPEKSLDRLRQVAQKENRIELKNSIAVLAVRHAVATKKDILLLASSLEKAL